MRQVSPSPIERVRSLAAAATPTAVALTDDPGTRSSVRGAVDPTGRAIVLIGVDHPLHQPLRATRHGRADLGVSVDLAAHRTVGSVPTVRARLWFEGWVSVIPAAECRDAALSVWERLPDEDLLAATDHDSTRQTPLLARVEPAVVIYDTYDAGGVLDGGAFLAAEPDPLAGAAERLLAHVNDRHRDELSAALAHIPGAPEGRAWLWELDRHGSTLWVQPLPRPAEPGAGCGPVLIRLPWSAPAEHPRDLERALHDLMHARPAPKVR